MRIVTEEFGIEAASLYLVEGDVFELAAVRGYDHPVPTIDLRGGRLARVVESGRGQVIPNITVDPDHRTGEARLELVLPLVAEGRCVGVLNVAWSEEEASSEDDRGLRLVADRLAVALALNRAIRGRSYAGEVRHRT
jgi:putative methionine-R-sulfoxide reductase with GAF domain